MFYIIVPDATQDVPCKGCGTVLKRIKFYIPSPPPGKPSGPYCFACNQKAFDTREPPTEDHL